MYELPDEFVVVYDFVPGDSVDKLVRAMGPLPVGRAVRLARDLCEAAGALHARGIIHRDIAPTNVVVSGDGAHLIDLGIARMYEDGAARDENSLGTWGYASPEQYGFAQTDPRSDIYSIGRLLAYMVCGIAPSEDGFDEAVADETVAPPALRAVIDKAPSFKATMDSYEAFFDKYVAFLKKYDDEGHPASMLADYSDMMTQYADYMQKLSAIDEDALSDADLAYYIEVNARIQQKLLTVS